MNNIISFFINKTLHILPYHTCTKWHERKSCHLEELLSKWNSNYRNAPNTTHYQVSKCHFPAKKYNPYKIYQKRKHAISIHDFFSKRPECQGCKFKALQTYRNSNNCNTPYASCQTQVRPPSNPPNINQRILPIVLKTIHPPYPMFNILLRVPLLSHISL